MATGRSEARRRVRTITAWAAGGAAALTAGFAFGAARSDHVAKAPAATAQPSTTHDAIPQSAYPQDSQGFTPPSTSTAPPAGMSGGS